MALSKQQKKNYRDTEGYDVQLMRAAEQTLVLAAIRRNELTDSEILRVAPVFDRHQLQGSVYNEGDYCVYGKDENGYHKVYKIGKPHTSQPNWYPDKPNDAESSARYELIGYVNGVRLWVRPTARVSKIDAPDIGDIVHWNGFNWQSLENDNLFEPTDGNPFWTKL